jgi:flagellar hook-associated protein 3 FlgL
MRVSQKLLMETTYRDLSVGAERLLRLQKMAASGKRVLDPSDDPLSALRIMELRGELSRVEPAQRKTDYASSWLSLTDSCLQRMEEVIVRAKEIAISQSNATSTEETRATAAMEVRQLLDEMIMLANSRMGDRYIFGGTNTLFPPVSRDESYHVSFHGNDQTIEVGIGGGRRVPMNVTATRTLQSSGIMDTLSNLLAALEANDPEGIRSSLHGLDSGYDAILSVHSEVGARVRSLESNKEDLGELRLDLESILSDYQDADMARILTDLVNQQTVYEAALRTTAMITRLNLMEFMG